MKHNIVWGSLLIFQLLITMNGPKPTPSEAAAILLNAPGKSNVSEQVAPVLEGTVGALPSLGVIYWRGVLWSYRVGYVPSWPGQGRYRSRRR